MPPTYGLAATLAVLAVLAVAYATPSLATPPSAEDRAALVAVAASADARWNDADATGLAESFTDDATLVLYPAARAVGRNAIRDYFARAFERRPGRLRHVTTLGEITMLTPDVALADGHVRLERQQDDGRWVLVRYFVNHNVAVREGTGWKLDAVRAHVKPDADAPR